MCQTEIIRMTAGRDTCYDFICFGVVHYYVVIPPFRNIEFRAIWREDASICFGIKFLLAENFLCAAIDNIERIIFFCHDVQSAARVVERKSGWRYFFWPRFTENNAVLQFQAGCINAVDKNAIQISAGCVKIFVVI